MTDLTTISHELDAKAGACRAVIESSWGARGKLAYDPAIDAFVLKRLLPAGMSFPLDFGFVPSTVGDDGDPLDIMVIHDEPLPMGLVVQVRLIGVIDAEQTEEGKTVRNDRLLGVTQTSLVFQSVHAVADLPRGFIETLTVFWEQYERLRGVNFKVLKVNDAAQAIRRIEDGAA